MPPLRVICSGCGQRSWLQDGEAPVCEECAGELRQMGPFEAFVDRWFAPPDMRASDMYRRHLQLVELLWTADGRGREFYEIVNPKRVSYSSFVKRVNALVCRGLEEGWIEANLPRAPIADDRAYGITIKDPDRFVDEMGRLFEGDRREERGDGRQ
jgi:hypothetical protein